MRKARAPAGFANFELSAPLPGALRPAGGQEGKRNTCNFFASKKQEKYINTRFRSQQMSSHRNK